MAIISNFELLVKRIAPTSGNSKVDAPFRRVVQGYFLTISNPNNRTVNFRIRARFPAWTSASPDSLNERELREGNANTRNHIYTYDITGGPNNGQNVYEPLKCLGSTQDSRSMITRNLSLGAFQTAAFKLLPDLTSNAVDLNDPRLEIRGYLEIAQLRPSFGGSPPVPVDLLFTPETRGTFLDNSYPDFSNTGGKLDFDQIAYSIATSTGAALIEVKKTEFSLILCITRPPLSFGDLTFKIPELVINDPLDFEEDFQGYRYLSSKGNKQLQEHIKRFTKKYKNINVDLASARRQVEEFLNDKNLFNGEKESK